ncbi:accessory Sec system translocase SecA2 [Brachybacterium alimentarium]|uniref:accessory Sec system translocase SecA2 n=1 Tax=Brachybacterium alimentarium TaxID=47845 RepID=UPI000DF22F6F|nr:accessory Sec system translocase SecA2 [Brachybacterium alimentarium]RCS76496.1 accessory Sec system translocase SecA2 [Brachybacterium alimentarium]
MREPKRTGDRAPWWRRPLDWVGRLRQDPGTTNLRRYAQLIDSIDEERAPLRMVSDGELDGHIVGTGSVSLSSDAAVVRFLAVASEVSHRRLGLDPFRVQLLAAVNMLRGRVVDMATGEGKTLVGFLVAAGLARSGRRVHVLSANDYLAGRDAAAGAPLFTSFGLSCAAVVDGMSEAERVAAYRADIVYATVHQVGFDLLRDRQRTPTSKRLVPDLDAAVVDEIDAVLLDDAMVPLVIAGDADPIPEDAALTGIIASLTVDEDYTIGEGHRSVSFTEAGVTRVEAGLGVDDLYAQEHVDLLTAAHVALHAQALVERDVHYLVADGKVRLINDTRGRVADRQRWPDGLHAAIERKEGLEVSQQAEILDQMLVETVARGYRSITGMSGTAFEAAERLSEDLNLRTGVVPTNHPCIRRDLPDRLFVTAEQRDTAAAEAVREAHASGQPVLVGTSSVADSERFASLLTDLGVDASVLNAKNDAAEAEIIAHAGEYGAVTVSTQMAGRGVDIRLGPGAAEAGGLLVLGVGRYDSARLDRQLRGRSGRQGDPGVSVFYTSIEDEVVTEQLRVGYEPRSVSAEGRISDSKFLRLYEHAQRVAEGKLLQLHRTTRNYHKTTDRHRQMILDTRERILGDPEALDDYLAQVWSYESEKAAEWGSPDKRDLAVEAVLYQLDRAWTGHLNRLAATREGIHLRVLGRQNPLDEFNRIAIEDFLALGAESITEVRDTLEEAPDDATSLADLGLRRPSSTWTYLVTDNPFGSEADRIVAFLGKVVRRNRPPSISYT